MWLLIILTLGFNARAHLIRLLVFSLRALVMFWCCQIRQNNRVQALFDAEKEVSKKWRNEDLSVARQAASLLLPLLQLHQRAENGAVLALGQPTAQQRRSIQQYFSYEIMSPTVSESDSVGTSSDSKQSSSWSRSANGNNNTSVRDTSVQKLSTAGMGPKHPARGRAQDVRNGGVGIARSRRQPPPLRQLSHQWLGEASSGRHYWGETPSEQQLGAPGESDESTVWEPEHLAISVLRLRGEVAMVRAVLEPPGACGVIHAEPSTAKSKDGRCGDDRARCNVRCMLQIEAYFPGNSKIMWIRCRICSAALAPAAVRGQSTPIEGDKHIAAALKEHCRLRQKDLDVIREMRKTEDEMGVQSMSSVIKQATSRAASVGSSDDRHRRRNAHPVHQPGDNAFSSLIIRADVRVPVERIHLGNGSWKETVGDLIGCPRDVELRTVSE